MTPKEFLEQYDPPALAKRCSRNLDPQHSGAIAYGGLEPPAAIEVALTTELPPHASKLVTIRPDLDSIGAMAVLALRALGFDMTEPGLVERVAMVAKADKFANGPWPGPRSLPTRDNPWPVGGGAVDSTPALAAMAALVSDHKVELWERVVEMQRWLVLGKERPVYGKDYRKQVEDERRALIKALEEGDVETSVVNGVAVVTSTHRAATAIGYCLAPVAVCVNPEYQFHGGDPHRKVSVCQYRQGFVDFDLMARQLGKGWAGSKTFVGSPQGINTETSVDDILGVVMRYAYNAQCPCCGRNTYCPEGLTYTFATPDDTALGYCVYCGYPQVSSVNDPPSPIAPKNYRTVNMIPWDSWRDSDIVGNCEAIVAAHKAKYQMTCPRCDGALCEPNGRGQCIECDGQGWVYDTNSFS